MFKLTFKQQVLTGFIVSLAFVMISSISSYLSIQKSDEDSAWQSHTYEVINKVQEMQTYLLNAESGLRGYVITEKETYLAPYSQNAPNIVPAINELRKLVNDNPDQVTRCDSLMDYADLKVANMQQVVQASRNNGFEAAKKVVLNDRGKIYKDKMLFFSSQIVHEEMGLLQQRKADALAGSERTTRIVLISSFIIFGLILFLFSYIRRTFDQQKETEIQILENNAQLQRLSTENAQKNWLLSGASDLNKALRGEQEIDELAGHIIGSICHYVEAAVGTIFLWNQDSGTLELQGSYAHHAPQRKQQFKLGQGLVGQAALEKNQKLIRDVPDNYLHLTSGLGDSPVRFILITPILFENETIAVIELGFRSEPEEAVSLFIKTVAENLGIAINSAFARHIMRELYERTQQQAEELETQQEELRTTNEELLHKSEELQASEEELRVQQEELQQTNMELEQKARLLEEQNMEISEAREAISLKAHELEVSGKYKSEFLANMSHELRTPLNSILILARILKENKTDNLNEDQMKYAGVIHNAGTDLLHLINDILDLSKIESGKIDLSIEAIAPPVIEGDMEALFREVAKNRKIQFDILLDPQLPPAIHSDLARIEQVLKNLLSNAFKFTPENGRVQLSMAPAEPNTSFFGQNLSQHKGQVIAFSVSDTGIGIPEEKQQVIFEAFQQADGSTSRKYGGTGLGLSISKELAYLLGGEIQIQSKPNSGSTFTLYLPLAFEAINSEETASGLNEVKNAASVQAVQDKTSPIITRANAPDQTETALPIAAKTGKNSLLIIEDDDVFAGVLKDYALDRGFKPSLAHRGDEGLRLATEQLPDAIILDIMLPGMDGWTILKKLKSNPKTRHIPVHLMSAGDEQQEKAMHAGAIGFLKKPVDDMGLNNTFNLFAQLSNHHFNKILLIEDQELQSKVLREQLLEKGIDVVPAFTAKEALNILEKTHFDCIILDLNLPDMSGFDLLDRIKTDSKHQQVPVVINTAMELQKEQLDKIMYYSDAMVLKSRKSNDRLIDEVSLFLNKIHNENKKPGTRVQQENTFSEKILEGKRILIADDDMRNIFALSKALESYQMDIIIANNGVEALRQLNENNHIDLVLMDIMMPEMDGYEAMRSIRREKKYQKLPIIALTAKAMKNDKEKCIEAGASDYIAKPVDMDQLLSMMGVWLSH